MTVAHFCVEEIQVRATAQRCYDLVLAVRRYGQWWRPIRCEALGPEGILRVGSRVRYTADFGSWVSEVARLEPHRRIDLQHTEGDLLGPAGWEFAPQGDVTRVRYVHRGVRAKSPSPGNAAVRRLQPVMRMEVLAGLRRVLEARGSDVSGGDLFEALHTQRAVRRFRSDPIADGTLREILGAATRAPSARNAQPWCFVAVRDPAIKADIGRHYLAAWRQAQAFTAQIDADADIKARSDYAGMMRGVDALATQLDHAPVLVLCCLDTTRLGPLVDAGGHIRAPQSAYASIFPAVQNLMLAARGLGIGSTLTTVFLSVEAALRHAVGLPDHMHIAALIPLGYPTRPFRITTRTALETVAFLDRWGAPLRRAKKNRKRKPEMGE
jgi:nitroreductase